MSTLFTIGEFSRLTLLSVKQLRNYNEIGLLAPAEVDEGSGYRRYAAAQAPQARIIRRLRDLEMPLDEIHAVLRAPDANARSGAIAAHLRRMEDKLAETRAVVGSLRMLLEGAEPAVPVTYRTVPATRALAVSGRVRWNDAEPWLMEAYNDLNRVIASAPEGRRTGPDSALYSANFFESHVGEITAYIPTDSIADVEGRVRLVDVPAVDLAVTVHRGHFDDLDQAYAALGTVVAEQSLRADGPIREHYLADDTGEATEVCWPIAHLPER